MLTWGPSCQIERIYSAYTLQKIIVRRRNRTSKTNCAAAGTGNEICLSICLAAGPSVDGFDTCQQSCRFPIAT